MGRQVTGDSCDCNSNPNDGAVVALQTTLTFGVKIVRDGIPPISHIAISRHSIYVGNKAHDGFVCKIEFSGDNFGRRSRSHLASHFQALEPANRLLQLNNSKRDGVERFPAEPACPALWA